MPTAALTASVRYYDPGTTPCYYLPAVAATNLTPTRAELNAGTNLSGEVADFGGFTVVSEQIECPDLATTFTGKIGGRKSAPDSSLTLYASKNGNDVKDLLPNGTAGYIAFMDGGDLVGNSLAVFPILVISCSQMRSLGNDAARVNVQFSVTRLPGENLTCPA
jgi:hypothetical protein